MASTSGELAAKAMDVIAGSGIRYAILHEEARIAAGEMVNDVDLVVDRHPLRVMASLAPGLRAIGLHPVIVNHYDAGGAYGVWLASADAGDGVQIDLMFDVRGAGKFGLKSDALIERAVEGERWRRINDVDNLIYLLLKRHYKSFFASKYGGSSRDLAQLVARAGRRSSDLETATRSVMAPARRRQLLRLVAAYPDLVGYRLSLGYRLRNLPRYVMRLIRPVGYWVEITGAGPAEQLAADVAERFGRFVAAATVGVRPLSQMRAVRWWLSNVVPVRWTSSLCVSHATRRAHPRADFIVDDATGTAAEVGAAIVAAMEQRLGL